MTSIERHEARYQRRKAKRLRKVVERSEKYTEWENVFGLEALIEGYNNVAKSSRNKTSTQVWMANVACNARKEQLALQNGTWSSPGFNSFRIKERGKWRDIQSSHISEKGIQNSFSNNCFIPIIQPHLIYDNGASLKDKGTKFSFDRFIDHLRHHIRKHGVTGGIYFFDFSSFFKNIDNKILIDEVKKFIHDRTMLDYYSKFTCAYGHGLGLGSQISQISALFYPNSIDHYIKDELGIECYGRHMDDGYIICDDLTNLEEYARLFEAKCIANGLVPNKKKCRIIKLTEPFVFLKKRIRITQSGKIIIRTGRQAIAKERHRLRKYLRFYYLGIMSEKEIFLNFHSWLMALRTEYSFHVILNAIRYYNKLFKSFPRYCPTKLNSRKYREIYYISKIA